MHPPLHMVNSRIIMLAVLGGLIIALVAGGAGQRTASDAGSMERGRTVAYVALTAGAGLLYAVAVFLVQGPALARRAVWIVLAAAVAMRLLTVSAPPLLSTDLYRYVWDGRVQAAGINPYISLPADPALAGVRDSGTGVEAIYPNINRADTAPTIYPPMAQAIFAAVGLAWPTIWGMKAVMLAFDAVAIGAGLMLLHTARLPPERVLIYAWNPLPVWEFAGGGHIDAAALALSGLALLAAIGRRPAWAGVALALAILCKLLPAALFPALWRRWDLRMPLACAAVIAAGYLYYADAGWRVLGYLPGYAIEEGLGNGSGFFLLRLLALLGPLPGWAGTAYLSVALFGLLALAGWIALRTVLPANPAQRAVVFCRDALWLGTAVVAVLSPHYPWYFAVVVLPAVLVPAPSALWLTLSAPVLYLDHGLDEIAWPAVVFLPFAVLLAREMMQRQAHPHPALIANGG